MTQLTAEEFKMVLPPRMKGTISQDVIDGINKAISCPEEMDVFKENLLSYTGVMQDGKYQISVYINAVKYVSFKLLGSSNKDAYIKTFPDKYLRFLSEGVSTKDIASYSTAYNKSKMVTMVYEQSLVPTHILNAHLFQQALNVQADLMMNAKSEKVKSDAANSLLTHLKRPEVQKIELDIGLKEDKVINTLRATTLELVVQQRLQIAAGCRTPSEIAALPLAIERKEDEVLV